MVEVDAIVETGASIVDMNFFEALRFKHYQGTPFVDDKLLCKLYIDRIYDTFIDEEQLQAFDKTIKIIADALPPRTYSSPEFIGEMGKYLKKKDSLVQAATEMMSLSSARLFRIVRQVLDLCSTKMKGRKTIKLIAVIGCQTTYALSYVVFIVGAWVSRLITRTLCHDTPCNLS